MVLGLLYVLVPPNISSVRSAIPLQQFQYDSLIALRDQAERLGEYPASALVIYKDSIIGAGYNTFRSLNDPLGHAEINALKAVFRSMDYFEFRALSRDSLILISSFEPCPMCKGVINHLEIRRINYLERKRINYRIKYELDDLRYYLRIRRNRPPADQ